MANEHSAAQEMGGKDSKIVISFGSKTPAALRFQSTTTPPHAVW
jgi:hypothetical protein